MTIPIDPLFSRAEAASYLGIKPATLAVWACSKRYNLPMVKVGRLIKYFKSDLDKWLKSRRLNTRGETFHE